MVNELTRNRTLLIITSSMMEIIWLYALASISFLLLNTPLFPVWAATLAFLIPLIITSILKGRGKRIITLFIIHLLFYILTLTYTLYNYGYQAVPLLNFRWIQIFFNKQFGTVNGFAYFLLIFWFSCFWFNGYKLINRSNDYFTITSRFDLGIVMLVLTFIISGAMNTLFPNSNVLICYYFLFSMMAIIIAQNLRSSKTNYYKQFKESRWIFTIIPVFLLLFSWVLLFLLPQMTSAAQAGYYILKVISNPIGKLLLKILFFLFGFRSRATEVGYIDLVDSTMPLPESNKLSWWGRMLQWILTWGGISLLILLTILALGWLLYSLWKWLSLKTELNIDRKWFFEELWLWIKDIFFQVKKILHKFYYILLSSSRKEENISTLFQKLCQWGRYSGIPRQKFQTPLEYGKNLAIFFPESYQDIRLIIDGFNQERYGKQTIHLEEFKKIRKAWRRLASPSKWPLRLSTKLLRSRKLQFMGVISSHP